MSNVPKGRVLMVDDQPDDVRLWIELLTKEGL